MVRTAPTWLARFTRTRHDGALRARRGELRLPSRFFGSTLARVLELIGDSARGADFALVRLRVEDGTIVDADAPGLAEDLRGLRLLEAAAVGGETLPVDALANAIGLAVRAAPDPARVAVALSGGGGRAGAPLPYRPPAGGGAAPPRLGP